MSIFKYFSYEKFNTNIGLAYAFGASILVGLLSHVLQSKNGIDIGVIGIGSVIGGALAPILVGIIIGSIRRPSKLGTTRAANIKQSIFYTALIMGFLIIFSFFSKKKNENTEKMAIDTNSVHIVINPIYTDAGLFSKNGSSPVMIGGTWDNNYYSYKNGKWGYIDKVGNYIIKPQYEDALMFADNNIAAVKDQSYWGYINTKGQYIVQPKFTDASIFSNDGTAPVMIGGEWNNISNKWVNGTWGYIDKTGEYVIPAQFSDATRFAENGLAAVRVGSEDDSSWGYINKSGKFVINPQFDLAHPFSNNGLAAVRIGDIANGKWGYINKSGQFVINPQFTIADSFSERGIAAVGVGGVWNRYSFTGIKYGYIDRNGKFLITPQYDYAGEFGEDGHAVVGLLDGEAGLVNEDGDFKSIAEFKIYGYSNGLYLTEIGGKYGYVSFNKKK